MNLLKYDRPYEGMVNLSGNYIAFAVSGDAHDYVEETSVRMQQLAKKLYSFPFYLYFEGYYDSTESILADKDLQVQYKPSGRTVLTQIGRRTFQAEVPAFTIKILDEEVLQCIFNKWFQLAFDNQLWMLAQEDIVYYENGFAAIEMNRETTILVTEHDASGFTFISNEKRFQDEDRLRLFLQEGFAYET